MKMNRQTAGNTKKGGGESKTVKHKPPKDFYIFFGLKVMKDVRSWVGTERYEGSKFRDINLNK